MSNTAIVKGGRDALPRPAVFTGRSMCLPRGRQGLRGVSEVQILQLSCEQYEPAHPHSKQVSVIEMEP